MDFNFETFCHYFPDEIHSVLVREGFDSLPALLCASVTDLHALTLKRGNKAILKDAIQNLRKHYGKEPLPADVLPVMYCNAAIMCSKCDSSKYPGCEMQPPAPVTCVSSGSGIPQSCSVVRRFNKETGVLEQFIRSCSISQKDDCFEAEPGFKTCAKLCFTDGCNSARSLNIAKASIVFLALCPFLLLLLVV